MCLEPRDMNATVVIISATNNYDVTSEKGFMTDGIFDRQMCYVSAYNEISPRFDPYVIGSLGQTETVRQVKLLVRSSFNDLGGR